MQHQTGLPGVGQVVRVCAPLFSQQLLGVSDGLHLDLEFQAFGPQGRQLRDELVAFPAHVPDRPSRAGAGAGSSRTGSGARRASSSCIPCSLSSCESMVCFQFRTTSALTPSSSPIRRLVASPHAYLATARRLVGSSTGARRSLRRPGSSSSIQRANTSWLGYPSARSVRRRHRPYCR
ncbi:hypothetical protein [Bifidobacterium pseudolongum]|uniref:hypothetical protein n=1 Tax=Bifidobacterium pseudolongum TaxID=1694 RepID=UPI001FFC521C|nr:hypothetical protein [Bifidobacterium pseudolongum]